MIRNINFSISDSEFNNVKASLSIFDISFGNFSGSNVKFIKCSSLTTYIFNCFNSFLSLDTISSTSFSNGFFFIQNSTLFLNNSLFNNYKYSSEYESELSVFCFPNSKSLNTIQVEQTLFFGISNAGNGSVKDFFILNLNEVNSIDCQCQRILCLGNIQKLQFFKKHC